MGIHARVQELLEDTNQSLIAIYLELQELFEAKYGTDTVVLMEVGSFFEICGVDNATVQIGKTKEIAEILNIQLTRKNKNIQENNIKNPLMAGARDNFEKGLSSFAVEMMEMRNIFNRSTAQSLILGDEISRGTETLSALAIVSAAIKH